MNLYFFFYKILVKFCNCVRGSVKGQGKFILHIIYSTHAHLYKYYRIRGRPKK